MATSNTATAYGSVVKFFHWSTALLILTLIPLGITASKAPSDTSEQLAHKANLFSLHKTLGITLFFITLARILWALTQTKPVGLHPDRKVESFLAEMVHWLLYGSLVIVPLTGWISHAATVGFAPIWWPFGQSLPIVPKDPDVAHTAAVLHMLFERVLVVSLVLHVAGALKHHFIDKDATLSRIWFGHVDAGQPNSGTGHKTPLIAALAVWAAAIAVGIGTGLLDSTHPQSDSTAPSSLAAKTSEWQVQDGKIALTIQQFGAAVEGEFATWTAGISFDPTITGGNTGTATVDIAIDSLTLGSVTDQAKGFDYFDAPNFPTATFSADLSVENGQHRATGSLLLKGATVPVSFPFDIEIDSKTATMTAQTVLNRQDFGIGDTMTDEGSLAFAVAVKLNVTATRTE